MKERINYEMDKPLQLRNEAIPHSKPALYHHVLAFTPHEFEGMKEAASQISANMPSQHWGKFITSRPVAAPQHYRDILRTRDRIQLANLVRHDRGGGFLDAVRHTYRTLAQNLHRLHSKVSEHMPFARSIVSGLRHVPTLASAVHGMDHVVGQASKFAAPLLNQTLSAGARSFHNARRTARENAINSGAKTSGAAPIVPAAAKNVAPSSTGAGLLTGGAIRTGGSIDTGGAATGAGMITGGSIATGGAMITGGSLAKNNRSTYTNETLHSHRGSTHYMTPLAKQIERNKGTSGPGVVRVSTYN